MDSVRCIHFADLHLGLEVGGRPNPSSGLNQRFHDVCDRFDEVCATAEAENVHLVVFAGDAFKHQHPSPTLQRLFAERVRRLSRRGTAVFLLVGNHDLPKMAAHAHPFSIYDTLEVPGVVVGDRGRLYKLVLHDAPAPQIQVGALPHFSRQAVAANQGEITQDDIDRAVASVVRRLAADVDPALPAIFAGHCHVNQAELSTAQNLFGISELEVSLSTLASTNAFQYFALGHVHRMQVLSREPFVAYAGSLERADFGEGERISAARTNDAEGKGFFRFDLVEGSDGWRMAAAPQFRPVRARRFSTVLVTARPPGDPTDQVLGALSALDDDFADAFVKVICRLEATERGRLSGRTVKDFLGGAYDVRVVVESSEDAAQVRDPRFAVRMSEAESLERYLESRDDWAEDRPQLLQLGRTLIEEVLAGS